MSHIVTVEARLMDLESIRAACARLGFEFREGQTTYKWYGSWVGDTPMPEGVTVEELGKCAHAIRVPGASYEVGVATHPAGGYQLRWDYWSSGGLLAPMGGEKGARFMQAYGVECARRAALRSGHVITGERVMQDGTIRVLVQAR
jgi:hypothetical protein